MDLRRGIQRKMEGGLMEYDAHYSTHPIKPALPMAKIEPYTTTRGTKISKRILCDLMESIRKGEDTQRSITDHLQTKISPAREHHECAMFEVDVIVSGTRREIYHIVAASKEAAIEQAMNGSAHPVNENYEPQDHTREVYGIEEIEFYERIIP